MTQPADPRRLLLSWRPKVSVYGAQTKEWVDVFKQRIRHQCKGTIALIDACERGKDRDAGAGTDRAGQREGAWTDFLATYTHDYLDACDAEPDHEFVTEVLHQLRDDVGGKRYWLVRLEAGNPAESTIGPSTNPFRPWADYPRWHFMPDLPASDDEWSRDKVLSGAQEDLSTATERECIGKLKSHGTTCARCRGTLPDPSAEVRPQGLAALWRRLRPR